MSKSKYIPHAWESVSCPFCNSYISELYENFGPELQYVYTKCSKCELVYQSPRPKYDEVFLNAAYGEYFSFDPNYKYPKSNLDNWDKELQEIMKFDKAKTSILDIGSCMGDFLKVAKKYYSDCVGIEVAENMAKFTEDKLNVKVLVGEFLNLEYNQKFSCIHMSHVIEHIPNPKDWLEKSREILIDGGILAMSIPNMYSLDRKIKLFLKRIGLRKDNWKDNTRTPDHLFEPNIPSLVKFFNDNGFQILEYYTYSRKDMDASSWFGKIYNRKFKQGSNLRFFVTPVK
jgi:ubiquinone/menaquinone biosynthesis C-methylase UbiE